MKERVVEALRMAEGKISPKAALAFAFPFIAAIVGTVLDWVVSGQFDVTAIRTAIASFGAALLALLGAWLGKPGEVVVPDGPVAPPASASGSGVGTTHRPGPDPLR